MWSVLCDALLSSTLDESTKTLYLVLSFWLVLSLTGFGAGLLFSFVSKMFTSTTHDL